MMGKKWRGGNEGKIRQNEVFADCSFNRHGIVFSPGTHDKCSAEKSPHAGRK
jgi:hypothetical protein